MTFKNNRLLQAIYREPVDATPIWMMRQAGRYLPEYRALRAQAGSFMKLCKTPELACEVTLQPLRRYPLDAAILFSDILTIPDAMGLELQILENKGPVFAHSINTAEDITKLGVPDPSKLSYVYDAIQLIKKELNNELPLIGFCGSPWTIGVYMIEGQSQPGFPNAMRFLTQQPGLMHNLLDLLAQSIEAHLAAQMMAGVDVVMLFDTWGSLLSTQDYEEFSLFYLKQIIKGLHRNYNIKKVPIILFTKGGSKWLEQIAESGCDVVGVDWTISLHEARKLIGSKVVLQGNMNPSCLLDSPIKIREYVGEVLSSFGHGSGHIFNLGHGITPDVQPEHVAVLINAVHELSKSYHAEKVGE